MIYLNDHIEEINVTEVLHKVSAQRAAYALRYLQKHDQQLSLAAYLLLQKALRLEYGIQEPPVFVYGNHGKPELKDYPEIHFNLSHCQQAALCVTNSQPVGCDVESVPVELNMDICHKCFNEDEIASIVGSDNPMLAFTTLWTQKEAFLKLTGEGLNDDLPMLLCTPDTEKISFQTYTASDKSYVYSVCKWIS